MPLNREALALEQSPSAAAVARHWVAEVCRALGRADLVDSAELGVSELVTNAILHGEGPIDVRVRGTAAHPRIEVFDASLHPPVPLTRTDREGVVPDTLPPDSELITGGRGLTLVAQASCAWGAAIEDRGKVVWFEPSPVINEMPSSGVIESHTQHAWKPVADSFTVRLLHLDAALFRSVLTQYSNLRRELRLLALAHDADYPLARDLSPMFTTFEHQFPPRTLADLSRRMSRPQARTEEYLDLVFDASPRSAHIYRRMLELFDMADSFCHSQHLLALARTPEQRAMQEWLLAEFERQTNGLEPVPWTPEAIPAVPTARTA